MTKKETTAASMEENVTAEEKAKRAPSKPPTPMDPALRLASKLDRIMQGMPKWAREWAIAYLNAKYVFCQHAPTSSQPPPGDPAYRKGASEAPDGDRR